MSLEVVHWEKRFPSSKKLYFFLILNDYLSLFLSLCLTAVFSLLSFYRLSLPLSGIGGRQRERERASPPPPPPVLQCERAAVVWAVRQTDRQISFSLDSDGEDGWSSSRECLIFICLGKPTLPTHTYTHSSCSYTHTGISVDTESCSVHTQI